MKKTPELSILNQQIGEITEQWQQAKQRAQPHVNAFWEADRHLKAVLASDADKAVRLAAYDRRMHAGHAGHPYVKPAEELKKYLERLVKERDRLLKEAAKKPGRPTLLD